MNQTLSTCNFCFNNKFSSFNISLCNGRNVTFYSCYLQINSFKIII